MGQLVCPSWTSVSLLRTLESLCCNPRWGGGRELSYCCGSAGSEFPLLGTMQAEVWLEQSRTLSCLLKRSRGVGVLPESDSCPSCSGRGSLARLPFSQGPSNLNSLDLESHVEAEEALKDKTEFHSMLGIALIRPN